MKELIKSDYVIYDKANDNPLQFSDAEIILYGDKQEADEDCMGNETVISCIELPQHWKDKLMKQINKP